MAQSCTLCPEATKVHCGKQTSDGLTPGTGSHYRLLSPAIILVLCNHAFPLYSCFKLVIFGPQLKCSLSSWFFFPLFCSSLLSSRSDMMVFVVLMWGKAFLFVLPNEHTVVAHQGRRVVLGVEPAPSVIGQEAGKHTHTSESPVRLKTVSFWRERKQFVEIWALSRRFSLDEPTMLHLQDIVPFALCCKHISDPSLVFIHGTSLTKQSYKNQSWWSCTLVFWPLVVPFSRSHNSEMKSAFTKPLHFPAPQWRWCICNCTCDEYQSFCRWVLHAHNSEAYGTYRRHHILLRASPCIQHAINMLTLTQQSWEHFSDACVCYIHVMRPVCTMNAGEGPGGIRFLQERLPADNGAHSVWVRGSFLWPTHTHRFFLHWRLSLCPPPQASSSHWQWLVELGGCCMNNRGEAEKEGGSERCKLTHRSSPGARWGIHV